MDKLAAELNAVIENKPVFRLLSDLGKRMYFPKGIISQSAEAKKHAYKYNATIGMAMEGGQTMFIPSMRKLVNGLSATEMFAYAPTAGLPELRQIWMMEMIRKNPSLVKKSVSMPIITSGLTHGLSIVSDLFVGENDDVVIPDMFWGNYKLIFNVMHKAKVDTFALFDENYHFNANAMEETIKKMGQKVVLLLNFPNNPTGYSPSTQEQQQIVQALVRQADAGKDIFVICDDSYFGLFFEDVIEHQSIFASLCDAHDNITAVKIDGATKEELVWGFRTGFITYGGKALDEDAISVLEKKTMGSIRSTVSTCSTISQNIILKGMRSITYHQEKAAVVAKMKGRYMQVKRAIEAMPEDVPLVALSFNSGYFMTFVVKKIGAENLRKYLLMQYGIGTISIGEKYLRVAFSSVDINNIHDLFGTIFKAAKELDR